MKLIQNNTKTNETIEKVAKALAWMTLTEHGKQTADWQTSFAESEKVMFRAQARVSIEALREVPDEIIEAANHPYPTDAEFTYKRMIDAILKE